MRLYVGLLLLGMSSMPSAVQGDAKADFEKLFGSQIKQVLRTPSLDDDLALAKNFLELAGKTTSDPATLSTLCRSAADLARKQTEGYSVAIDAWKLLAKHVPAQRMEAMDQQADLLIRVAARGTEEEKADAGPKLVQLRLALGDAYADKRDWARAAAEYRQASAAARRFDTDAIAKVTSKLKSLLEKRTLLQRAASLEEKVLRDATNQEALAELTEMYLIDLNQPARAKVLAPRLADSTLKIVAMHASDKPATLNEATSLTLAEWFSERRQATSDDAKARLLDESLAHYQRYLELHQTPDLARKKVELFIARLKSERSKIDVVAINQGTPTKATPDQLVSPSRVTPPPTIKLSSPILAIAYSPDGKLFAMADNKMIRTMDRLTNRPGRQIVMNQNRITLMSFSPDSKLIAVDDAHLVRLWDLKTMQGKPLNVNVTAVRGIAFTEDGKTLGTSASTMTLTDITSIHSAKMIHRYVIPTAGGGSWTRQFAMSPDGKTLVASIRTPSGGTVVRVFDPKIDKPRFTLNTQGPLAISPNGKVIATCKIDGVIFLWDAMTGKEIAQLKGHRADVSTIAFSHDGTLLASGSSDTTVKVWDLKTNTVRITHEGHGAAVLSVAFAPDGREIASGSSDRTIRFWRVK